MCLQLVVLVEGVMVEDGGDAVGGTLGNMIRTGTDSEVNHVILYCIYRLALFFPLRP